MRKHLEQKPIEALSDPNFFKVNDWKRHYQQSSASKPVQSAYVAVNHSLHETSEFMHSFTRNRVFRDTNQIVEDARSKSQTIVKESKYIVPTQSAQT